jgi:hypothetical protein
VDAAVHPVRAIAATEAAATIEIREEVFTRSPFFAFD